MTSSSQPVPDDPPMRQVVAHHAHAAITVISASQRRVSNSAKVARLTMSLLRHDLGVPDPVMLDLGQTPFPWWSEDPSLGDPDANRRWAGTSARLRASTAFVFVTPEWGGMAPPALKNLFLLCDDTEELADKPALIVGVSSGHGGAYVVAELRASSYKNTRVCYIPEHVLVRHVRDLFSGDELIASEPARDVERRLTHALALLLRYAEALCSVRASAVRDREFRYGM